MPSRPVRHQLSDAELLSVLAEVRRYLLALGVDPVNGEELVQETAVRVWESRWRIERETAVGYAVTTARSLLGEQRRQAGLLDRHLPRLADPPTVPDAFDQFELQQEHAAVAAALAELSAGDRDLLIKHHVDEVTVAELAAKEDRSPAAIATALNRARGRLRLEYCLRAYRRQLTDVRCRRVLTAIAVGDLPRQRALGAGRHLPTCPHCGPLSQVITGRDRHHAGLGPLWVLVALFAWLRHAVAAHPAVATTASALTAGGTTAVVLLANSSHHPPQPVAAPRPAATTPSPAPATPRSPSTASPTAHPASPTPVTQGLLVNGRNLLPQAGKRSMRSLAGQLVRAVNVPVVAVDANEGFWIGSPAHRMWVQLHTAHESPQHVQAGDLVSFTGQIQRNPDDFAQQVGLTSHEDAALAQAQQVHVEASLTGLKVHSR